jgi:lambda family phage minor tail protein L
MTIAQDAVSLAPGAQVQMIVIDAAAFGGPLIRLSPGTNELGNPIVWQGLTYSSYPLRSSGWEATTRGPLPRPKLALGNLLGAISALCLDHQDLVGARVTRKRTLAKYLDAANFAAGNPLADPSAGFPDDIFTIDRKATENAEFVEFDLAAAMDVAGVRLPRRQIISNVCSFRYRGPDCGYAGGPVAKSDDTATTILAEDRCGHRVRSCKLRWGAGAVLPYGGFPAVGQYRGGA